MNTKLTTQFLLENNITFKSNYDLKFETYFKSGGNAEFFILPKSHEELILLINFLKKEHLVFKLVGFTSNTLFINELSYTIIISTKLLTEVKIQDNTIEVSAGYSLENFVRLMLLKSSKGYEGLEGIPASIGGAIFMNAGAYGYAISNNLISVKCYSYEKGTYIINKKDCNFKHRESIFKSDNNIFILSATFNINEGSKKDISNKITKFHIARHSYQEFAFPSLGSLFSLDHDFYRIVLKKNLKYYIVLMFLKILLKNKLIKTINRKNPVNNIFNKLVVKFLNQHNHIYSYSEKSMNILINDGTKNTKSIIKYIKLLKDNLEGYPIENEIVLQASIKNSNYEEIYNILKKEGLLN